MEATTTVPRTPSSSAARKTGKPLAIVLGAEAQRALRGAGVVRITRPVATKAPAWARGALLAIDAPGEFWWADNADAAHARRVEDPFRCPWGGVGQALSVSGVPAMLASVGIEGARRTGFHWVIDLRSASI